MECNISELVKSGHERAAELKASCCAVDVRSVAQLIRDLASQLEVQLVRSNTLAAENAALKQHNPSLQTMITALEAFYADDDVPERGMLAAYNILRTSVNDSTTEVFLAEVRAQVVYGVIEQIKDTITPNHETILKEYAAQLRKGVQS
ncbi:hypothetical protein EZ710_23420 [Salmonella enterica subsp. enterica serovar Livingstone]|nr:hypothetical protein [Salmonella enterica subsp. enterica serovar Livingstone]